MWHIYQAGIDWGRKCFHSLTFKPPFPTQTHTTERIGEEEERGGIFLCFLEGPLPIKMAFEFGGTWDHGANLVVDSPTKTSTLGKLKPTPSPYPPPRTKKLSGFPFLKIIIIITTNQCKVRPKGKEESMSPSSLIFYILKIIHFLRLSSQQFFF